jgi:hypothetical protein
VFENRVLRDYLEQREMSNRGDWMGAVDWIQFTQNRDRWRSLVNKVMDLRVQAQGI